MFKPSHFDEGKLTEIRMVASQTIAKGDALAEDGNGFYQRATSGTTLVRFVAQQDHVDSGSNDWVSVVRTSGAIEFVADTAANPSQTQVGTCADLTDHDTLNSAASSNDVFFIEEIVGPVAGRKVRGYFLTEKAS